VKAFEAVGILVIVGVAVAGGVLGFSVYASHGILAGVVGAIAGGIVVVLVALYAVCSIVAVIEGIWRAFRRK
jgi:hypothetical protein